VAVLRRFRPPGLVADSKRAEWSALVKRLVSTADRGFAQFYDPTVTDTPASVDPSPVVWSAFPASLRAPAGKLFEKGDRSRGTMDEYCEWAVERNRSGKITRITFTTEVPEYFGHLFKHDRARLLDIYQTFVSPKVKARDLERNKRYLPRNKWNKTTKGRPAHLIQGSNTLGAAVGLAAQATILRRRANGEPVTTPQQLVACGALGNPLRNSDPQIASVVNDAARAGDLITLADPAGLYIDGLITGGMATPDGANPASFWKVERGKKGHAVRAAFEVPKGRDYVVGDITIGGQPIEWGGQLAVRVRVRLDALVKPASRKPKPQPCIGVG
jgi:hypothetical protein